jgi:DNA polymerase-3 subunit beta
MQLECKTKNLKEAVIKAQKIIVKNSNVPILSSILLQTVDKSLFLRSTNLHIGVELEIPANIEKQGIFLVSGEVFMQVLSSIPDEGTISLFIEDSILKIQTKKSVISINSSGESSEFPNLPSVESKPIQIPLSIFMEGVRSVYYCASISDIKPEISSVYIYSDGNELTFVSTDSFRLAEKKVFIEGLQDIAGILIPYKNILELIKLLSDSEGTLLVSYSENQITLSIPGLFITSRIVNGSYPNYKMIIPKEFKTEVIALKQDLLNTLKLSTIFSDKFNQINLSIDTEGKRVVMKAKNSQKGENISEIDATINGNSLDVNFNHRYFAESFQSISTDSIILQCNEENKPVVVQGVGDKSFLYLIMPMNR